MTLGTHAPELPHTQLPVRQASGAVQAFPSEHVFVSSFVNTQPETGLQESSVHGLASMQLSAGPPTQVPPAHVSDVVQAFPSLQDAVLFVLTQPVDVLHESFVHTLPSLQLGAGPPTQIPPLHVSTVVQAFPSLHDAVLFALTQPVDVLHESFVQTLPSLQLGAGPPTQVPPAHVSAVVQAFPSLHDAVLFVLTQPVDVLHESFVQTLPSLQLGAGPPTQMPPLHVSAVVQAFPSLHDAVLFALTQPVDVLHESFVQTLPSLQLGAGPPTQMPPLHASARRAGVPVAARRRVVRVDTARRRVARVVRAHVAVVAVGRRAADAGAAAARVCRRARVPVVARRRVVRVDAARRRVARVVRADVAVVAVGRRSADTDAAAARIRGRAGIPVAAGNRVVRVDTARRRVARVVRAHVAVVAVRAPRRRRTGRRCTCPPSCRRCRRCRTPCCSC